MRFDIGGRRNGKTTRMIQWLLNGPEGERRILVTHSISEADRVKHLLAEMGIERDDIEVVSANDFTKLHGRNGVIGIDNVELVLQAMTTLPITRVTATGELYQDE